MSARTVTVPPTIEGVFARAEKATKEYFAARSDRPEEGTIEISGERYILVRAASMSVEFVDLIVSLYADGPEDEARGMAADFLFDLAHATGKSDARHFHESTGAEDPVEKLSLGPIHFAHRGWASVVIDAASRPVDNENYVLMYDHPYSFEADAWLRRGRRSAAPVCAMNAGYSSGWCEESFGVPLIAAEVMCRAAGDEACRFVMAPPWRIEEHLARAGAPPRSAGGRAKVPEFFQRRRLEDKLRRKQRHIDTLTDQLAAKEGELRQLRAQLSSRREG